MKKWCRPILGHTTGEKQNFLVGFDGVYVVFMNLFMSSNNVNTALDQQKV